MRERRKRCSGRQLSDHGVAFSTFEPLRGASQPPAANATPPVRAAVLPVAFGTVDADAPVLGQALARSATPSSWPLWNALACSGLRPRLPYGICVSRRAPSPCSSGPSVSSTFTIRDSSSAVPGRRNTSPRAPIPSALQRSPAARPTAGLEVAEQRGPALRDSRTTLHREHDLRPSATPRSHQHRPLSFSSPPCVDASAKSHGRDLQPSALHVSYSLATGLQPAIDAAYSGAPVPSSPRKARSKSPWPAVQVQLGQGRPLLRAP